MSGSVLMFKADLELVDDLAWCIDVDEASRVFEIRLTRNLPVYDWSQLEEAAPRGQVGR